MNVTRLALVALLASAARGAAAHIERRGSRPVDFNPRAFSNPEEFIDAPQNPHRVSVGFGLRIR